MLKICLYLSRIKVKKYRAVVIRFYNIAKIFFFVIICIIAYKAVIEFASIYRTTLDIISIGTIHRKCIHGEYLKYVSRNVYIFNEKNVDPCIVCQDRTKGLHPQYNASFRK